MFMDGFSWGLVSRCTTGHTVCTTIHSNSCESTYRRMMTLAKRKYSMDDSILMQIMVEGRGAA